MDADDDNANDNSSNCEIYVPAHFNNPLLRPQCRQLKIHRARCADLLYLITNQY